MFSQRVSTAIKPAMRAFSTTPIRADLSRVQLIGRMGADPEIKKSEKTGAEFTVYPVATAAGSWGAPDADGKRAPPPTSWHNIYCFNENQQEGLSNIKKGTTVFVEADLKMIPVEPGPDGQKMAPRAVLTHRSIKTITKPKPAAEE